MNILDENVSEDQRQWLQRRGVRVRQIGREVAWQGIKDDGIIPLLHRLRRPTFFTRDLDFYDRRLCHATYCLVYLDVAADQVATFIHLLLHQPAFDTEAKRMGTVVHVSRAGIRLWRRAGAEQTVAWLR